ncbi:MAG TPA: DUF4384 domain-containing protein [Thermoanaerobaculia bacterium]
MPRGHVLLLRTLVEARSRTGRQRGWKIATLGLLLGSVALPSAALDPARGAASAAVLSPHGPLSYRIELLEAPVGPGTEVTERRIFHTGEKIRLYVRSTSDGFVSLVQVASSGELKVLFPRSSKSSGDMRVRANEDRALPTGTEWFEFDETPRTEKLLLLFRPTQRSLDDVLDLAQRPGQRELPDALQIELRHQ